MLWRAVLRTSAANEIGLSTIVIFSSFSIFSFATIKIEKFYQFYSITANNMILPNPFASATYFTATYDIWRIIIWADKNRAERL